MAHRCLAEDREAEPWRGMHFCVVCTLICLAQACAGIIVMNSMGNRFGPCEDVHDCGRGFFCSVVRRFDMYVDDSWWMSRAVGNKEVGFTEHAPGMCLPCSFDGHGLPFDFEMCTPAAVPFTMGLAAMSTPAA